MKLLAKREELRNELEATKTRMAEALDSVNEVTIKDADGMFYSTKLSIKEEYCITQSLLDRAVESCAI